MPITAGIDVGTGCVKVVLFDVSGEGSRWLAEGVERLMGETLGPELARAVLRGGG